MARPIAVDLFAGVGGLSLGFEQAGFDVVAAVEIDPVHCAAHRFNFPDCAVIPRSISDLNGAMIRAEAKIGARHVDVVFGGAPCQGFSMIGKRAIDDPRNSLVRDFVRVVSELKPSYFVFENVKGLTQGNHRFFLEELIETFGEVGYRVRLPWLVLDAADFGVPQHRERLILIGARKGRSVPDYPEPLCLPADSFLLGTLPIGPTCADALSDLPDADRFKELLFNDATLVKHFGQPSEYAAALRGLKRNSNRYGYNRRWNPRVLTSSLRTEHTDISRRRFEETEPGQVEPISRFFKLAANGLSNTLRAGTDSARGAFTSPRPIHYAYSRCITVREMARLHGFPDWFRFHATKWHGARQIGNSVPPPLGRAIASRIINEVGGKPAVPVERIKLGDPALLAVGMSQASQMFEVEVPIARRDRKSGARKRKQHEIEAQRLLAEVCVA
jgi:DNA (cytosine-5)-methyltransferase 1